MRTMKESGIEWIGEIPEQWDVAPTKRIFTLVKRIVGKGAINYDRLALTMNGVIKRNKEDAEGLQPADFETYQILLENELVFKLIDLENIATSRVGYSSYNGIVSSAYIILSNPNQNNMFYYYYFISLYYRNIFNTMGQGVRSTLSGKELVNKPFIIPPTSDQQCIADFLDEKCALIDGTIENQKKSIEKLKEYKQSLITEAVTKGLDKNAPMKDSGIEWIGEIPQGWDIKKTAYVFNFNTGLTITKEDLKDIGISCINYGEIHSKYGFDFDINRDTLKCVDNSFLNIRQSALVNQNDFVFCDTSEDIEGSGNCVYIQSLNSQNIFAGSHTIVAKPKIKIDSRYLAYLFSTPVWRAQIRSVVSGTKVFSITQKILKSTKTIIPSFSTQQMIVNYLDKKCCKIEKSIEAKQKIIYRLNDYKKSLIYEAVTGKIEV